MYEAVEFFGVQSFGIQIRCSVLFDIHYLSPLGHSAFSHSVLGPYSALGPIWHSVIRRSVIRRPVFRRSVIRRLVIRRPVFRRSVGESKLLHSASIPPSPPHITSSFQLKGGMPAGMMIHRWPWNNTQTPNPRYVVLVATQRQAAMTSWNLTIPSVAGTYRNRKGPITLYMRMKLIPMMSIMDPWACELTSSPLYMLIYPFVCKLSIICQVGPYCALSILKCWKLIRFPYLGWWPLEQGSELPSTPPVSCCKSTVPFSKL